jgi:hypothetical protein
MSVINLNPFRHQDRCLILPPSWSAGDIEILLSDAHTLGVHTHLERYPGGIRVVWILLSATTCDT